MSEKNTNNISEWQFLEACRDGNLDIVKKYIEQGGNIHVTTNNGNDGFSRAIYRGNLGVAEYLLDHGADINTVSDRGKTPLHRAIYRGKLESIKFLIAKGAKLDLQDHHGDTALHYAAQSNYNIIVKLLVDHGANLNIKNNYNKTALDVANSKTPSLQKWFTIPRNIYEGNKLSSDALGSVQEIIEAKLLDQNDKKLEVDDSENKISEQEENVEPVLEKLPQNTLGDTQPEQKIEEDSSLVGRDSPHSEEGD